MMSPDGQVDSYPIAFFEYGDFAPLIRPRQTYAYVFTSGPEDYPGAYATARFDDDTDLHWQLTSDLRLEQIAARDDR
jgi:hypothetical protein